MDLSERIDYLVRTLALNNANYFAERCGFPFTSLSKWRNGVREPGRATLQRILDAYPEVRSEWLFEGRGDPIRSRKKVEVSPKKIDSLDNRLDRLERMVDELLSIVRGIAEK